MAGTFTWTPDRGLTRNVEARVNSITFGDGYEQRVGDGINTLNESVPLSFTLRTKTEINAIEDFFAARAGIENFDWTNPRGQTLKYTCKAWSPVYNHDGDCSLTCVLKRDFGA
jgi:phage-related protein